MRYLSCRVVVVILVVAVALTGAAEAFDPEVIVDMEFRNANVLDVLQVLGELGGLNVLADQSVGGSVTFYLRSLPILDAIDLVARTSGYRYKLFGNTLVVASAERLASEFTQETLTIFQPKYLSVDEARDIASLSLNRSKMVIDERTGALILWGPEPEIIQAESLLERLDVPVPVEFEFVNTSIQDILRTLAKAGGYSLIIDPAVDGLFTIYLHDLDIPSALRVVAETAGLECSLTDGVLFVRAASSSPSLVASRENPGNESLETAKADAERVISVRYLSLAEAQDLILTVAPNAKVRTSTSGLLAVQAAPDELKEVEQLLAKQDYPKLRVTGVVRAGENRLAIIELNGRSQVVMPGDEIAGILVESIGDRVVMVRKGEYQRRYQVGGDL